MEPKRRGWGGVVFAVAALAACGGGGGDPPPGSALLTGVAASGAPLADGVVVLIDSRGVRRSAVVDASGRYHFDDVQALKPPFLLRALGTVGGQRVALHAPVLGDDLSQGVVNVTPLTELVSAAVLGGKPDTLLDQSGADFSRITPASVTAAADAVKALVRPVLTAVGVADADIRTSPMLADHAGLDLVLDALSVTLTSDGYSVATTAGSGSASLDTKALVGASPVNFTADEFTLLRSAAASLPALNLRLAALSAAFATGLPEATTLKPFFSSDFLDGGLDREAFIADLRATDSDTGFSLAGASFDNLRIVRVLDADNLVVSFRVKPADGMRTRPWEQRSRITRVAGQWILRGDGEMARVSVSLMSRIVSTPMAEATLAALPDVFTQSVADGAGGLRTAYGRRIRDDAGNVVETLWLSYPGSPDFGLHGWTSKDQFAPGGAAWRSKYQQYYGSPSSHVRQYLVLEVPARHVASQVASVVVTGPGLPPGGLTLQPPRANRPRPYWVFAGDSFDWNAFDTARCEQVDNAEHPVPQCGLDITKIDAGAMYTFSLRSSSGSVLGTLRPQLAVKPRTPEQLVQRRDELFPQFRLETSQRFTYNNLFDDQGSFVPGKTLTLNWWLPTAEKSNLSAITFFVEYPDANGVPRDASTVKPLYASGGVQPTAASFVVPDTPIPLGAWSTLVGFDHFGNEYQHEVNPDNPY